MQVSGQMDHSSRSCITNKSVSNLKHNDILTSMIRYSKNVFQYVAFDMEGGHVIVSVKSAAPNVLPKQQLRVLEMVTHEGASVAHLKPHVAVA